MPSGLRWGAPARPKPLRATCFSSRGPRDPAAGRGQPAFCAERVLAGRKSAWPAERFGASAGAGVARRRFRRGGCLPGRALLAFGLRTRRCAAHFPLPGHVILAPMAGLAGPRAAKPQLSYAGRPVAAQTAWPEPPNCAAREPRRGPKAESAWCLWLDQPESAPSDLRSVHIRDERRRVELANVLLEPKRLARVEHRHD